jgi:hypothetical protein
LWQPFGSRGRELAADAHCLGARAIGAQRDRAGVVERHLRRKVGESKRQAARRAGTRRRRRHRQQDQRAFLFAGISFVAGDHLVDSTTETAAAKPVASFKVTGTYTSDNFKVGESASGHLLITYVATPAESALALAMPGFSS